MAHFELAQSTFVLNPQYRLQWEEAQKCHVILYPEGVVQLSDSAAMILQRCLSPTRLDQIVTSLEQQFPEAEGIEEDIKAFLLEAQAQDWIVEAQSEGG